jgi:hypothetical protein
VKKGAACACRVIVSNANPFETFHEQSQAAPDFEIDWAQPAF